MDEMVEADNKYQKRQRLYCGTVNQTDTIINLSLTISDLDRLVNSDELEEHNCLILPTTHKIIKIIRYNQHRITIFTGHNALLQQWEWVNPGKKPINR